MHRGVSFWRCPNFHFFNNYSPLSTIFEISGRVGKSAICKALCVISGHILLPVEEVRFRWLNRPFVRRFGFNFGDVRIFIFFKKNHRPPSTIFMMSGRVDKSAIYKAFCAISGHILGSSGGVSFWWSNRLLLRRFGFNFGDVRIFIFC